MLSQVKGAGIALTNSAWLPSQVENKRAGWKWLQELRKGAPSYYLRLAMSYTPICLALTKRVSYMVALSDTQVSSRSRVQE
jgi:hypothetical protein